MPINFHTIWAHNKCFFHACDFDAFAHLVKQHLVFQMKKSCCQLVDNKMQLFKPIGVVVNDT
jgi:extradiol dioxygenase family protein